MGVNRLSFIITPVFLLLYTIIHPFISQGLLFGDDIYTIYLLTFKKIASILNLGMNHLVWAALVYATAHIILGLFSGWLAFSVARKVEQELSLQTDNIRIHS